MPTVPDHQETLKNTMEAARDRLLDAALPHVVFEGWSDGTLRAALADSGMAAGLGPGLFPRGGIDMAVAYHRRGDRLMVEAMARRNDLATLKIREKITLGVRLRLEAADRELARRGAALFALPAHAGEGAALIWGTADAIWDAIGDTSRDFAWYSKRATLSAVYAATVLYWMGDDSPGHAATWEFLDRRIEDVMRFEKTKARARENPLLKGLFAGPLKVLERVSAPERSRDLPGHVR